MGRPIVRICALLLCCGCFLGLPAAADQSPDVGAAAYALLEAESGELLLGGNCKERLPMASTTKIMTAYTLLRICDLEETVTIPKAAAGVEGSSMYLSAGETLTVEALLYGLLLQSANDAAVALAIHAAGSIEEFVALMNADAQRLGLQDTHFVTVNGLDDPEHYTTALDLARLTAAALQLPEFAAMVATKEKVALNTAGKRYFLKNHNRLLREYPGCIGVKTGYTMRSGRCLVSAAKRDGMTLIAVTLCDRRDWADHRALLDYGFSRYRRVILAEPEAIRCMGYRNREALTALLQGGGNTPLPTVRLTVQIGSATGEAIFTIGQQRFSFPLTPDADVMEKDG